MEKTEEEKSYEKTLKIGDKVRIICTCKEFSDSCLKGLTGILGKQDIVDNRDSYPDIIFLDEDEVELLENVKVELVETTMNMLEDYI